MAAEPDDRFVRYRDTGSRRLRNELVEANLDLVDFYAQKYRNSRIEEDDVRQQAFIALINAVERFDPDVGVTFKTFANRTIDGELKRLLRDKGWSVRPPRSLLELSVQIRRAEPDLAQELGRAVRVEDLADRLDESTDRILEAMAAGGAFRADSLDVPVTEDQRPRAATLAGDRGDMSAVENQLDVDALLETLDERDRQIIHLRYVERWSQQDIADELGVSQSYLSRLLRRTLAQLREELGEEPPAR